MNNQYLVELRDLALVQDCPGNTGLCDLCLQRLLHTVRVYLGIDAITENERQTR